MGGVRAQEVNAWGGAGEQSSERERKWVSVASEKVGAFVSLCVGACVDDEEEPKRGLCSLPVLA